jgi:hypothetical protein
MCFANRRRPTKRRTMRIENIEATRMPIRLFVSIGTVLIIFKGVAKDDTLLLCVDLEVAAGSAAITLVIVKSEQ